MFNFFLYLTLNFKCLKYTEILNYLNFLQVNITQILQTYDFVIYFIQDSKDKIFDGLISDQAHLVNINFFILILAQVTFDLQERFT